MRGHRVQRRFGWDCHGLPVENLVEKEEGLKSKKDIEEKGIRWFNDKCRDSVTRYTEEWRKTVERTGRWVDMDWDYRTMDPDYMESIWWVFKNIYDKGLIYEGHKAMHICTRCVTPLSNFEVTLGYSERTDMSTIATFPLVDDPNTVILAWTTTTWSLPGDLWLGFGADIKYVRVKQKGDDHEYVVSEKLAPVVFKNREYEIVGSATAKEFEGKKYVPLFDYYVDTPMPSTVNSGKPKTFGEHCFYCITHPEVAEEEGTGIVHFANTNAEDGFLIAKNLNTDLLHYFGVDGRFYPEVRDFAGLSIKAPEDNYMKTDKKIIEKLKETGRWFDSFNYTHSYPHCWRCESPLLNYVGPSWYVAVEKIKDKIIKQNKETSWVPAHIRDGRFGNWLEGARDWAISRNRFWGTPLPIWRCENSIEVIGSRDELMSKCPIRFTKVTVLRHAESEGNVVPIYQGEVPGTSLTRLGKRQAEKAGRKLVGENLQGSIFNFQKIINYQLSIINFWKRQKKPDQISVIYASPLARAKETADIIAKKTGAKVIIDERLREVSFGEYEGKTIDFSDLTFVKDRRAHKIEKGKPESIYHFDGMEKWESVQERVEDFMKDVLPKHRGEHITIVSHADPIVNMKHFFTGEDPVKLSHQPYPKKAEPYTYFWDHDREAQLDLHKDTVDDLVWPSGIKNDQSVEVTLVRHGETDWNLSGKVQGYASDPHLTELGKEQVKQTASELKGKKYDLVISSDLPRAVESAEIISEELGIPFVDRLKNLRERDDGDMEGKTFEEISSNHPEFERINEYKVGFHYRTPPNGETFSELISRVNSVHEYLMEKYAGKKILIVSHHGVLKAFRALQENLAYKDAWQTMPNASAYTCTITTPYRRIPDVLDCWFESGSMPYAQSHFPFEQSSGEKQLAVSNWQLANKLIAKKPTSQLPSGFPADFIAENLDQTRGWFYTLMVLSTALFNKPAFQNCICGGMILAEDGKKMSKRLKNYPDPNELMERHGADALRFTLMSSPVVRAQELRFSEKPVEETLRRVILPLWNTYHFFVLHAEGAESGIRDPESGQENVGNSGFRIPNSEPHPLDQWVKAEVQDLVNRMTEELDRYDLSATCSELYETLDALTNWYVRRSRRRFSGKEGAEAQQSALATLYEVLLTFSKLLAPFCPFITEAIYLNLVPEDHGSIHMSDWPEVRELTSEEKELIERTWLLRTIVSLGMGLRSEANVKVRQPLVGVEIAIPLENAKFKMQNSKYLLSDDDRQILAEELNVKNAQVIDDASHLADRIVQVDARKAGPRLGKKVQEIIKAAKAGEFTENSDGSVTVLGEKLSAEEAQIIYQGKEGRNVACEKGIVVSLDSEISDELKLEGLARDVIRAVQALRKEKGLKVSDRISLKTGEGMEEVAKVHQKLIEGETNGGVGDPDGLLTVQVDIIDGQITVI